MIIGDLETDGLMDSVTKIHCANFRDSETGEVVRTFRPQEVDDIPSYLDKVPELSFHNGLGYDLLVLKKLYDYEYKGKFIDTLLLSRLFFPDIENVSYEVNGKKKGVKNKHSIESWAIRFGMYKIENEDWSVFTEHMLERNLEDTRIARELYLHIQKTIKNYENKDSRLSNWGKIFAMETKFWQIMEEAADNGWMVDLDLLFDLEQDFKEQLKTIDDQLVHQLPIQIVRPYDTPCVAFKKDGALTVNAIRWVGPDHEHEVGGDFSRVKFEPTNPGSPDQLKEFLLANGWEPLEYNYKRDRFKKVIKGDDGKPIITSPKKPKGEDEWDLIARDMDLPAIKLLVNRAKIVHRLGLVKSFIEAMRSDRRVPSRMSTLGCVTQRVAHRIIANIPKPDEDTFYGKEMRSIFICPDDKVLVGTDASALEARCEAHYLYQFSKEAALTLIEGDIHTINAEAWQVARKLAKNGKYALAYGCAKAKLAKTLGKPISQANDLYEAYWNTNPAAKQLKAAIERQWEKHGYIVGIDGRPLNVRYKHALLNTLLQSCGAIVMKAAMCFAHKEVKKRGLDAKIVCFYHDEFTYECNPADAEQVKEISLWAIKRAGEYYKLNVPLEGDSHTGKSWALIH